MARPRAILIHPDGPARTAPACTVLLRRCGGPSRMDMSDAGPSWRGEKIGLIIFRETSADALFAADRGMGLRFNFCRALCSTPVVSGLGVQPPQMATGRHRKRSKEALNYGIQRRVSCLCIATLLYLYHLRCGTGS